MKRTVVLAFAGVVGALGVAGFALYSHYYFADATTDLEASLGGATRDEEGPAPSIGPSYDLAAHQTLSRVILLIKENYVEPERIDPYRMFLAALEHIERTVAEVIVDDSEAPRRIKVSVGDDEHVFDLERLGGLDQPWEVTLALRDIFRFIQGHISDPVLRRDIEYAAINGMLSTLDPHSVLLPPDSFDEVKTSTKGEFGGLGIVISIKDGALTVISPIDGTPAARAGIKAKDQIARIGEESTVNMTLEEAVDLLRGKEGTKVNVWVLRKGWSEPRRFSLVRAKIKIESVASELLADGVGYVRIKSFQANTYDDLDLHLEKLRRKNNGALKGLVLDLRNNPGGLLDQAILVSDRFIEEGPIVITVGEGNRTREVKSAHPAGTDSDYPMAVLVNGGSASASEIVAGALKNHGRALVIGQQTFGKGSVQVLYDFRDKSALKLTIAQYLTPGDESIQSIGITPDVEIVPSLIEREAIRFFVHDDSLREKDLEHHLDKVASAEEREDGGSTARVPAPPMLTIAHLQNTEADKAAADEANPDRFVYDFETRLAHDLLAGARDLRRPVLLEQGKALFAKRAAEEEALVVARFAELGVDWTSGPDAGAPRAEVDVRIEGLSGTTALAGSQVTLVATVRNTGDAPLYRVYGVTGADAALFKNIELVFGKIPAGESRRWEAKVKLPQEMSARGESVSLSLGDLYHRTNEVHGGTLLVVSEQPRPRFAYRYTIDDSSGNGDGVLQVGEEVGLKIEVQNIGAAACEDAVVSIKNLSAKAVFLKQGRDKTGPLKPGASKVANIAFSMRAPADVVDLRLTIWDTTLGEAVSEQLRLPVEVPRKSKPLRQSLRVDASAGVSVYAGANASAPVLGLAKSGAVLRSDASFAADWLRVLFDDRVGFVRTSDVAVLPSLRKATPGAITLAHAQAAPEITLEPPTMVTSEAVARLKGKVRDGEHLRDMYLYVNDKKILYRSFTDLRSGPDGVEWPIDLTLPLTAGSNSVALVVRESDELTSRRVFTIFRQEAGVVAKHKSP